MPELPVAARPGINSLSTILLKTNVSMAVEVGVHQAKVR
jgi:hypothetical protein